MTSKHLTSLNLEPFLRNAIGVDRIFENMINRVEHANTGNYPPYNIIQHDENNYQVEVAVAGFAKEDISVTDENSRLIIEGGHTVDLAVKMLHNRIISRDLAPTLSLADHVEVTDAKVENGILTIDLERMVPEALKPKQIEIK